MAALPLTTTEAEVEAEETATAATTAATVATVVVTATTPTTVVMPSRLTVSNLCQSSSIRG